MRDKYNPNEYRIIEKNGSEYTQYGRKYTLKKGVMTLWYWRRNLWQRWELTSFQREGIESVTLIIGDPHEEGYGFQDAPWEGWKP
jgi:hypothetical protein